MPDSPINRHATVPVRVGTVVVGGNAPVVVQSMTNTDTADVAATTEQVRQLAEAGSELVRLTVNTEAAAAAVPAIRKALDEAGCHVPLVGDFHFNGHKLLEQYPACAQALEKYRINPGNVGRGDSRDNRFASMIELAVRYDKAVRIGVNWGSMDQELVARMMDENARSEESLDNDQMIRRIMVVSALESAYKAEELGLGRDHIILSVKMSGVQDLIAVYRELAKECDYALHLGLTEAGMGSKGIVASTAALAVLLQEGIGDTIRISLTPEPVVPVLKRWWWPRRSCSPWAFAPSPPWSSPAPAVVVPAARFSSNWPRISRLPEGADAAMESTFPRRRDDDSGGDGLCGQRPG